MVTSADAGGAKVLIIGGGLAGLACGLRLQAAGVDNVVLEASDATGGRIRTDVVDGFLLDRGFQVLLTAYPEARRTLDLQALDLHPFRPGALIRRDGGLLRFSDPWRRPGDLPATLAAPVGTLSDKLRVAGLRQRVRKGKVDELFGREESTTERRLREEGFSPDIIERFFRPFLGGIFLERDLQTSSRMFEFVFRMFADGEAALPAAGMEAIPRQLVDNLSPERIRTNVRVAAIEDDGVITAAGERLRARAVVVACEGPEAARLVPDLGRRLSRSVTCLYFAADAAPVDEPMLVLDGEAHGPVNNLCVPSQVCSTYAPAGAALISASIVQSVGKYTDGALEEAVRRQLRGWFGPEASRWRHLRTYRIADALPDQSPPFDFGLEKPVRLRAGLYVCGDHRATGSIDGALRSGKAAGDAVVRDLCG